MYWSRRDFGKLALAGLSLNKAFAKKINSKIDGVQLGVQSYSFRDLSLDQAIQAMVADGLGDCELFSPHIEAGGMDDLKPLFESGSKMTPAERRAAFEAHDKKVQEWRLSVPLDYFKDVRKKFDDAGIALYAYNLSFNEHFTDPEIDRGFLMAKALGVGIITAST